MTAHPASRSAVDDFAGSGDSPSEDARRSPGASDSASAEDRGYPPTRGPRA